MGNVCAFRSCVPTFSHLFIYFDRSIVKNLFSHVFSCFHLNSANIQRWHLGLCDILCLHLICAGRECARARLKRFLMRAKCYLIFFLASLVHFVRIFCVLANDMPQIVWHFDVNDVFRLVWFGWQRRVNKSHREIFKAKYFVSSRIHCSGNTIILLIHLFTHHLIVSRQTVYERFQSQCSYLFSSALNPYYRWLTKLCIISTHAHCNSSTWLSICMSVNSEGISIIEF